MPTASTERRIRVFVHLAHGFGAKQWQAKWERGEIIGLNDRLPYGYFWAQEDGCSVEYSEDRKEGPFGKLLRLGMRLLLGFDLVHAWRNRRGIIGAEIVWTHTESQYLAVLLLLQAYRRSRRPKVLAQSVWLLDQWSRLSRPRRWAYRKLIAQASVLTVHSPENLKLVRALFPMCRSEMIPFGVKAETMVSRDAGRAAHRPVRVLSVGNDRHRDWVTIIAAVREWPGCVLRVVAPRLAAGLIRRASNVEIIHPKANDELSALYDWADLVALAIKPNLHASGITVVEEATVFGVPVICTDTGGLKAYFSDAEVRYVPPGEPEAMRRQIAALAEDDHERGAMVARARARMIAGGLTSRHFGRRHAELSRELLGVGTKGGGMRSPLHSATIALAAAVLAAGFAGRSEAAPGIGSKIDLCAFRPSFTEDFNTLSVSPWGQNGSRWIAHTPWHGDFGDAAFVDPQPGFPFRVHNGILSIEARKNANGKWQSGLLASVTPSGSGFAQRYGYFEMRAKLPPGPGTWPAFWLNSVQQPGSKAPGVEIDVIEYYGQFPAAFHSAVHVWNKVDPKNSRVEDHITNVPSGSLVKGFHTYGADVEKNWITFYLDRRETGRLPTPPELRDPMMILVNLALGSGWPIDHTPNPSIMQVDYIHVYEPYQGGCRAR